MNQPDLYVFEYGGTARSGKGTIVSWLSEVHPEVATEETGADYRAVTLALLADNTLEVSMLGDDVEHVVEKLSLDSLADLAAHRKEIEADNGKDALYSEDINGIVQYVSPLPMVRKAVKEGFAKRVETIRDNDEHRILLVDGRNLGPVIEGISGTSLVLRTFVYCVAMEAARRECLREGLQPGTPSWHMNFGRHLDKITVRNNTDKNRELDPVVPDQGAIDYWKSQDLIDTTTGVYSHFLFEDDDTEAIQTIFSESRDLTDIPRIGAGFKAVSEKRQLHFDTTPFTSYSNSRHAMLLAANTVFEEALRARQILDANHV